MAPFLVLARGLMGATVEEKERTVQNFTNPAANTIYSTLRSAIVCETVDPETRSRS
jgi:hypothetical protein